MEFNKKLKDLRESRYLSQQDLANALKINQTTISTWELGKKLPDYSNIKAIAKFFDVSADFLLGLAE